MGEVYKARDTRLDRTVAIKVLPEHIAKREDLRARFEREARPVAALNHPNICTLHDLEVCRRLPRRWPDCGRIVGIPDTASRSAVIQAQHWRSPTRNQSL
jgi:serine/threonine protein kinase